MSEEIKDDNLAIINHQDHSVDGPFSQLNNYEENESAYGSDEINDYSNLSLTTTTTNDSSGSNLCMQRKFNPLEDPIIQEMFKQRTVEMDKVEEERRIRMYTMMRYSKKYKHLQTERANIKWDKSFRDLDSQLSLSDIEDDISETPKKSSSPNWLSGVSHRSLSAKQPSTNFGIDLHDLDLVDMELNNNNCSENSNEELTKPVSNSNDNLNDDNEETFPNHIIKVYSNSQESNLYEIAKSNSKTSNSSSENDFSIEDNTLKHPYKLTRTISDAKRRSFFEDENGRSQLNDSLSNSDFNNHLINNYISNSDDNSTYINTINNSLSNNDIHSSTTTTATDNSQDKNKKKIGGKKVKLFKLGGHKTKNCIEISDTNTHNRVSFHSDENVDSDDNLTMINPSSNEEIPPLVSAMKNPEKKKKYYGLVKFFTGKKNSKNGNAVKTIPLENNYVEPNNNNIYLEPNNKNNYLEPNNKNNYLEPNNKNNYLEPNNNNINNTVNKNNVKSFKKTKSIRFSDSVNIIP